MVCVFCKVKVRGASGTRGGPRLELEQLQTAAQISNGPTSSSKWASRPRGPVYKRLRACMFLAAPEKEAIFTMDRGLG